MTSAGDVLGGGGGEADEARGEPGLRGDGDLGAAGGYGLEDAVGGVFDRGGEDGGAWRPAGTSGALLSIWPTKLGVGSPPVRMRPGQTVVTRMPLWRSSAWRPSEKPTRANLLAL